MNTTKDKIRVMFPGIRFSSKVCITDKEGFVEVCFDLKNVMDKGMQDVANAFEGWVIASYLCSDSKVVVLELNRHKYWPNVGCTEHLHWNRFLYRAMKFSEQYSWFRLSVHLEFMVNEFRQYLSGKNAVFENNIPDCEAGGIREVDNIEKVREVDVEYRLSLPGKLQGILGTSPDLGSGWVYRQLPVGLYQLGYNRPVFTDHHSAVDLWNIKGDTINIVELKTKRNKMEIITEIFFYANYIYDFLNNNYGFTLKTVDSSECFRGYGELIGDVQKLKKVNGIMLADNIKGFHPLVNENALEVLNDNGLGDKLNYYMALYSLGEILCK